MSVAPAGGFVFSAEPGEANEVTVVRNDEDEVVFTDDGAELDAGAGCTQESDVVTCPDEETTGSFQLGDEADSVDLSGMITRFPTIFWGVNLGQGGDTYRGQALGLNSVYPGEGDDQLYGGAGGENYYLAFGVDGDDDGTDFVDGLGAAPGGAGSVTDHVLYEGRSDDLELSLDGVANDGAPGEEDQIVNVSDLTGGEGDDLITGDERGNELYGDAGVDTISGGAGGDRVYGGFGVPFGRTDSSESTLEGGPGRDYMFGTTGGGVLLGGDGEDSIDGGPGAHVIRGGTGNDDLNAGDGGDFAYGGEGNDDVKGGDGDDRLRGNVGRDFVEGGKGDDGLWGGSGPDTLSAAFVVIGENQVRRAERGADDAHCGPNDDKAFLDPLDTARGCEDRRLFYDD